MPKKRNLYKDCNISQYCNSLSNQYLVLVTIFAAIISQEIQNDEDLGILGSFLVALGEEISLSSEVRIACKARFDEETEESNSSNEETVVEDVFDRSIYTKPKKIKKVKKNIRKKYK